MRNLEIFLLKAYLRHGVHYIEVLVSKPQVRIVQNNVLLTVPSQHQTVVFGSPPFCMQRKNVLNRVTKEVFSVVKTTINYDY